MRANGETVAEMDRRGFGRNCTDLAPALLEVRRDQGGQVERHLGHLHRSLQRSDHNDRGGQRHDRPDQRREARRHRHETVFSSGATGKISVTTSAGTATSTSDFTVTLAALGGASLEIVDAGCDAGEVTGVESARQASLAEKPQASTGEEVNSGKARVSQDVVELTQAAQNEERLPVERFASLGLGLWGSEGPARGFSFSNVGLLDGGRPVSEDSGTPARMPGKMELGSETASVDAAAAETVSVKPEAVAAVGKRYSFYSPEMNLLAETEIKTTAGAPAVLYEYVWFNGHPVAQVDSGTTTHWTFTNHLGTPTIQTDTSAAIYWRAEHEPYGKVFALRSADQHQPLRLPGQEAEQLNLGPNGVTERSYNIFRWYRPTWGRYTQADPVFDDRGLNTYSYAAGNPVILADPRGQAVRTIGCDVDVKAKITRAAEDADAASQTCVNCRDRGPFRQLIRSLTITCLPFNTTEKSHIPFCGRPTSPGGSSQLLPPFQNAIDLTPIGVGEASQCGCLKGTILHEVLHVLGSDYDDFARDPSKNTYDVARRCFRCAGPNPFRFSTGVTVQ
jgi:RHS repeat-associated protein